MSTTRFGPGGFFDIVPREGQPFPGVSTYPVNPDVRQRFGLAASEGALVVDVTVGSPADVAGMRAGDVITALGDRRISSATT